MKLFATVTLCLMLYCGNAAARSKNNRMPASPIKLYYLPPSPPCRAVMMTAKVLGLDMEMVVVNLMAGEHKEPAFLKMNPAHTIPVIDDNGFILYESRAIMQYLVNQYGKDDFLYPKNPRNRAIVDMRLFFDIGTLFAKHIELYRPMFQGAPYDEAKAESMKETLGIFNTMLEGKTFAAGDNFTIADISIVVTFTNLEAFKYDFNQFENIKKWFERTKKHLEPYGYMEIDVAGAEILGSLVNSR